MGENLCGQEAIRTNDCLETKPVASERRYLANLSNEESSSWSEGEMHYAPAEI